MKGQPSNLNVDKIKCAETDADTGKQSCHTPTPKISVLTKTTNQAVGPMFHREETTRHIDNVGDHKLVSFFFNAYRDVSLPFKIILPNNQLTKEITLWI